MLGRRNLMVAAITQAVKSLASFMGRGGLPGEPRRDGTSSARPELEMLESRIALATDTFTNPAGGSWRTASNWSLSRLPTSGDDVVIPALSANATVTASAAVGSIKINSLSLDGTLRLQFGLSVAGSVSGGGTMILAGGRLSGATISKGITITQESFNSGSTLDNVTLNGDLVVAAGLDFQPNYVTITNGSTLNGTITLGDGTLNGGLAIGGALAGTGTILFAGTSPYSFILGGSPLTIGAGITIVGGGGSIGSLNEDVVNEGTIKVNTSGGVISIGKNYTQTSTGKIEVQIDRRPSSIRSPPITIVGTKTLAGTLEAQYINGFIPSPGQPFLIIGPDSIFGGGAITGTFTSVIGGTATYEGASVILNPAILTSSINPTSLAWDRAQGGVGYGYQINNSSVSKATNVGLYWSSSSQFTEAIGSAIYSKVIASGTATGSYGPFNVPASTLGTPPAGAKYLLEVTDPGNLLGNFDPKKSVIALTLPDVAVTTPSFDGTDGGVDFSYTISGADLPEAATIALYWSRESTFNPADMDRYTLTYRTQTPTTQTSTPVFVHVGPMGLIATPPLGTRYLLVVADPDNQLAESDTANNVAFVASPAAVVNVVTHGYNPYDDGLAFFEPFADLGIELTDEIPAPDSVLDGKVKSYVPQWDSTAGWAQALTSVALSLELPSPLNRLATLSAQLFMNVARANAEQAAQSIAAYITNPQNGYLLSPTYGQHIDLIGHSRGAAVNALVSQLLATKYGYTVDQYTSLDGYSTDWPYPASILGDISITGTAMATRKVNYEVQQGLGQVLALLLLTNPSGGLVGISQAELAVILAAATDWRAPNRSSFGFQDQVIPGPDSKGNLSNHLNIVELYSNILSPYIYDNYEGYNSANPNSPFGPGNPAGPPPPDPPSPVNYSNFTDGSFKTLGMFWDQLHAANISAGEDPLLSYWLGLVNDPTQFLASTWTVTGDAKLVENGGQAVAELDQTDSPTSIGQYLELDSQASSIGFDMSVLSANPGDRLLVLFNDNVLGSFDLANPSASGHETVSLAGYASQMGEVSFRLVSPAGDTARVQLDNLTVNEANMPLTVEPIPAESAVAGTILVVPVTANDSAPGGTVTYSLEPGAASGVAIDPKSGILTWSVPTSVAPGDYPITVRVTDNGNPALSATTSFTVTVGFLQQPTNLSTVSGTGAYGGSATLTATLTAGLPLGGPPVAGKLVTFTLDNGGIVTTVGTTTTDQNGVATLTGVSLTGFNVGMYSGAITASFGGDLSDLRSTASGDLAVNPDATSSTVAASADPSYFGQSVTFRATVSNSSASITPAGSVQFAIDGTPFGSPAILINGSATSVPIGTLAAASHSVTAVYVPADGTLAASSGALTQTVNPALTSTTLIASVNLSLLNQQVTLTVTVGAVPPGSGTPTGNVQFQIDGANFGSPVTLSGTEASFSTSSLGLGPHTVSAVYIGDGSYLPSVGSASVRVIPPAGLSGLVFEDFNDDGQVDFGENGIAGVTVTLAGTDDLGNAVSRTQATDSAGIYSFDGLRPGNYTITEKQPAGYIQGVDTVGTWSGAHRGSVSADDQFGVAFGADDYPAIGVTGINYNFGERPAATGPVHTGQTAGIGFWYNKKRPEPHPGPQRRHRHPTGRLAGGNAA